jgi:hypothetical protein
MVTRSVTLALPEELLSQAHQLAVEQGTTLSGLLANFLQELVQRGRYEAARATAVSQMRQGVPMGVGEKPGWTRDDLHER